MLLYDECMYETYLECQWLLQSEVFFFGAAVVIIKLVSYHSFFSKYRFDYFALEFGSFESHHFLLDFI